MSLSNNTAKRASWIFGLIAISIVLTIIYIPSGNYLPPVKRDTIDTFIFFPPGINIDTADKEIAQPLIERLAPHLKEDAELPIHDYFLWSFPGTAFGWLGINGADDSQTDELFAKVQNEIIRGLPDTNAFALRMSLFGGFEDQDSVVLNLHSNDLNALKETTGVAIGMVMQQLGVFPNPFPDPSQISTELQLLPKDERLAEVGWSRDDLAVVVRELGLGLWLGEYFDGEDRMDIYLRAETFTTPEQMAAMPVSPPKGGVIPLSDLVTIERRLGPSAIITLNGKRSVMITINPPEGMGLEDLLIKLKADIEPELLAMLPADGSISYGGSAKDFERAIGTLSTNFILAFFMLFMIMAALFKSIRDALIVTVSIPLAAVGGVVLLAIMKLKLDLLAMIGFIILLGLVVNNAILLVAQTRRGESRGLERIAAVHDALRLRLRPIFMSTLTSIFGMMPLLLFPGAGSDIYKGMAAVIVGGMSISMIFTLILLPALLQWGHAAKATGIEKYQES